ncbi:MAG: tyrosine-type recombinase/integrase [bacterium]
MIDTLIDEFIDYMRGFLLLSYNTVSAYSSDLSQFTEFLESYDSSITPVEIDNVAIRHYIAYLYEKGISKRSVERKISTLKTFFRFLKKKGIVDTNPASTISFRRTPRPLPNFIRTPEDAEALITTPLEYRRTGNRMSKSPRIQATKVRDMCIMRFLYGLGIRSQELVDLDITDIDTNDFIHIKHGKGGKMRIVPMGNKTKRALERYLAVRKELFNLRGSSTQQEEQDKNGLPLFINMRGHRISTRMVRYIVSKYVTRSGMASITPHTFRHSFATHIYEAGADIRVIQELLGHVNIDTTDIYTHISLRGIREKYDKAHPHSKLPEEKKDDNENEYKR